MRKSRHTRGIILRYACSFRCNPSGSYPMSVIVRYCLIGSYPMGGAYVLAGVEGIEPSAYGFGDRRSTS